MKNTLIIQGGKPLQGSIPVQGAKNEALQIIPATILFEGKTLVRNIPNIRDVQELIGIFCILGGTVQRKKPNSYLFDATNINPEYMKTKKFRLASSKLRGSLMIAGAMLARFGIAYMPMPGGDKIGIRNISTHLKAFEDLGAVVSKKGGIYKISFEKKSVSKNQVITLSEASVTGTANLLLASVFYRKTNFIPRFQIYNAACEPYIQKLCKLLKSYGAKISGVGSNLLTINPVNFQRINVSKTKSHTMSPDMIELGSLISLAVVAGDGINIKCPNPLDVLGTTAVKVFKKLGVQYEVTQDGLFIPRHKTFKIKKPSAPGKTVRVVYDQIWPGLSPDHISTMITLSVHAQGTVTFEQRMFEGRLLFVDKLISMGAEIVRAHDKMITVTSNGGPKRGLRAIEMSSPDIRAGMALLIAALSAKGTSTIRNAAEIHRGYENIVERLRGLGAKIEERD